MYIFLSWLTVLLTLFGSNNGQDQPCNFYQFVRPGMTYHISNPGYPKLYSAGSSCQWIAESDRPIRLTCEDFHLPFVNGGECNLDRLIVQDGELRRSRYCNDNRFTILSRSNRLTLTLVTKSNSPGGWFHCAIETEQPQCECGRRNPTRIVGGDETGVNEYPMMAAVIDKTIKMIRCGATIINVKQVLTAAHCVVGRTNDDIGVLVGDHDLRTGADTAASKLHRVAFFVKHQGYNPATLDYDIALITVADTIAFNHYVGPVCLPFQRRAETFAGNFIDVLGWGASHAADGPMNILMKARMGVITKWDCERTYRDMTDRQMCVQEPNKDSCQFDSGGPLLWQSPATRRVIQVGIISSGKVCANGAPFQNTRTGPLLDWIQMNTFPGITYCQVE